MNPATTDRYAAYGLLLSLILGLCVDSASAQDDSYRSEIYLRTHVGLSGYWGDLDDPTGATGRIGAPTLSWEVGFPIDGSLTAAAALQAGDYPRLDPSGTWHTWRFSTHLLLRYDLLPTRRISPFANMGAHLTAGSRTDASSTRAYGPSLGGGIRYRANPNLQLFAGTTMHFSFPDEAVDGLAAGRSFDLLSSLSAGVQFNLTGAASSLDLTDVRGADSVRAGEDVVFSVRARSSSPSVDYRWTFGDGSEAAGQSVRHVYDEAGTYTVTVNGKSNSAEEQKTTRVVVEPTPDRENPVARRACEKALSSADTAYRTREFASALDSLQTCLTNDGTGPRQQIEAYRLKTLIQLKRGEIEAAKNTLLQIFALAPDYEADTVHDPPAYVSLVSIVKEQIGSSSAESGGSP